MFLPGTLWAKTLRSPYSHARIKSVDTVTCGKSAGCARGADRKRRPRDYLWAAILRYFRSGAGSSCVSWVSASRRWRRRRSSRPRCPGAHSSRLRRAAGGIRSGVGAAGRRADHSSRLEQLQRAAETIRQPTNRFVHNVFHPRRCRGGIRAVRCDRRKYFHRAAGASVVSRTALLSGVDRRA